MSLVQFSEVSKSFNGKEILKEISFSISSDSIIGLVGANGTGKTTLFKIIIDEIKEDDGTVSKQKGIKIAYLAQIADVREGKKVIEEALEAHEEILEIEQDLNKIESKLSSTDHEKLADLLDKQQDLIQRYSILGGYEYKIKTENMLRSLGFSEDMFNMPVSKLSGGQKNRLSLIKILLSRSDLILLDEPTNFLDIESTEWLEGYIKDSKTPMVIISHDRYFLDKTVNEIWELSNCQLTRYKGNYSKYQKVKKTEEEKLLKAYIFQKQEIQRQEDYVRRNIYGQKHKMAQSRRKMLEKMERIEAPKKENAAPKIVFGNCSRGGNSLLNLENISHSFNYLLFENLNLSVQNAEKISIVGPNGCGKTTLLNIIAKKLMPTTGKVTVGRNAKIGYYHQELKDLDPEKTVFETIKDIKPTVDDKPLRDFLARFLFKNDEIDKYVENLSGGEQSKLALAKIILEEPNFLVLDEPTNHLDIPSREALEEALNDYEGTLLFVSHDRYFIDKIATRILFFFKKNWKDFYGNYSEFQESKKNLLPQDEIKAKKEKEKKERKEVYIRPKRKKKKLTLKQVEDKIMELETKLEEITTQMTSEDLYKNNVEKLKELKSEYESGTEDLEKLYKEWEELAQQRCLIL